MRVFDKYPGEPSTINLDKKLISRAAMDIGNEMVAYLEVVCSNRKRKSHAIEY